MAGAGGVRRVSLDISRLDNAYYAHHGLTLADPPEGRDDDLTLLIVAFCFFASPELSLGPRPFARDEPELTERGIDGGLFRWISLGCPEPRRLRRAAARCEALVALAWDEPESATWWLARRAELARVDKLSVLLVGCRERERLRDMTAGNPRLSATVQENSLWLSDAGGVVEVSLRAVAEEG